MGFFEGHALDRSGQQSWNTGVDEDDDEVAAIDDAEDNEYVDYEDSEDTDDNDGNDDVTWLICIHTGLWPSWCNQGPDPVKKVQLFLSLNCGEIYIFMEIVWNRFDVLLFPMHCNDTW